MTSDLYIQSVVDQVPHGLPLREQIAMELRSHIAERVAGGQPLDDVLRQLGDPVTLAESYLAAVPMHSADVFSRLAAKVIDFLLVVALTVPIAAVLWFALPRELQPFVPVFSILVCVLGFVGYTVLAEYWYGRTLGKRLLRIHVVRESGRRISLGQSVVRQLPFFAQFFWVDAIFALFTERRQRAFELLSKTRAVAMLICMLLVGPEA
jgi:uncharacterized RDD family membrane protein YckC